MARILLDTPPSAVEIKKIVINNSGVGKAINITVSDNVVVRDNAIPDRSVLEVFESTLTNIDAAIVLLPRRSTESTFNIALVTG